MRDPTRIDRVLEKLAAYWHRHPDLRLGQLMVNANLRGVDVFYIEDDALTTGLAELEREDDDQCAAAGKIAEAPLPPLRDVVRAELLKRGWFVDKDPRSQGEERYQPDKSHSVEIDDAVRWQVRYEETGRARVDVGSRPINGNHTDGCPGGFGTSQSGTKCATWCRLRNKDSR